MIKLSPDERIDWFRIFSDFERAEISLVRLSLIVDIPRTTLIGLKSGSQAKLELALRVLRVWSDVTGSDPDKPPVFNPYHPETVGIPTPQTADNGAACDQLTKAPHYVQNPRHQATRS